MTGIDRFVEGTQRQPNVFQDLQNLFIPNPGELRTINGVTKLQNGIPGLQKITHSRFLDTNKEKGLIVYYEPSTSMPSAPGANFTFSTSGGGAVSRDVFIEYIVAGGGKIATKYAATSIQANGLTITINSAVNGSAYYAVQSINVYVKDAGGIVVWSAGAWRESGLFPTSMIAYAPGVTQVSSLLSVGIPPGKASLSPQTNGQLQDDRIYYLGLGPWFGASSTANGFAECAFKTASTTLGTITTLPQIFSVYLPKGNSSISFQFNYCPLNPPDSSTLPTAVDLAVSRAIVYCGVSPEDMMPVSNSGIGYGSTISKLAQTSNFFDPAVAVVPANNTIALQTGFQEAFPVGACLKFVKTAGAGDLQYTGGITLNGKYFYVVNSVFDATTNTSTVKLAFSPGGTVIAFTLNTASTWNVQWARYDGVIKSLPKSLDRIPSCSMIDTTGLTFYPRAVAGRGVGVTRLTPTSDPDLVVTNPTDIACAIFTSLDFSFSNMRHISVPVFQPSANLQYYSNVVLGASTVVQFEIPIKDINSNKFSWSFKSRQYGNRLWSTNNYNEPFYTNGYVLKSGIPSDPGINTFQRWPITKFIEFYKDRMILASDSGNQSYSEGYFYFSMLATGVGDIQDFSLISTTPNALPVNTSDQSILNGLNIYSQDLTSVGAESFLVIGKEASVFSWDGNLSNAAKQITRATGFAGPECYALSRFGPIYVGRDNVYLFRSSQEVIPIGDPIKDIIAGLTKDQLNAVTVVFHDQDIKIGYTSSGDLDQELWLRMVYKGNSIAKEWSGPHLMKPYKGITTILSFSNEINVRVSNDDTDFFRRDDPGSFLNDGQDIARKITISNMGLQYDQFLKLITEVKLALRTTQDENLLITLESEDGSQSIVVSSDLVTSGNLRRFKTIQIPQRFLARVLKMTIENTSSGDFSVYDVSVLFQQMKRRLLP